MHCHDLYLMTPNTLMSRSSFPSFPSTPSPHRRVRDSNLIANLNPEGLAPPTAKVGRRARIKRKLDQVSTKVKARHSAYRDRAYTVLAFIAVILTIVSNLRK